MDIQLVYAGIATYNGETTIASISSAIAFEITSSSIKRSYMLIGLPTLGYLCLIVAGLLRFSQFENKPCPARGLVYLLPNHH